MPSKLILSGTNHAQIQALIELKDSEDYSVVTHRVHGNWKRSIHVYTRLPTTKELTEFENLSSKVKFSGGGKARVEAGAIQASETLYNKLIERVYDLPIGMKVFGEVSIDERTGQKTGSPLNAEQARAKVPPMIKREALRDFIGEVYSESRIAEREDEDDEVKKDTEDD